MYSERMRMRSVLLAGLLIVGCKKEKAGTPSPAPSPKGPASTAEQDAVWKLAPDGAMVGIVMSPRGIAAVEAGWLDVKKMMDSTPDFAPALREMDEELTKT